MDGTMITGLILIVLGIFIKHGRMHFLIAGFNTMPKEEREKVDLAGIALLMRNVLGVMGLMMILLSAGVRYTDWSVRLRSVGIPAVCVAGVIFLIIAANSDRYKKENQDKG